MNITYVALECMWLKGYLSEIHFQIKFGGIVLSHGRMYTNSILRLRSETNLANPGFHANHALSGWSPTNMKI